MKTTRILIAAIAIISFSATVSAQTGESANSPQILDIQEVQAPSADIQKRGEGWWQFGVTARMGGIAPYSSERSIVANAGYRLNKKNYIGMSLGYGKGNTYFDADCGTDIYYDGMPVTFEYLHNFYLGKAKKHSIYLGGELGVLHSWETAPYQCGDEEEVHNLGSGIFVLKTGFDFQLYNRLHLNFGLRVGLISLGASVGISF